MNSAYPAATMFVSGWVVVVEDVFGRDVEEWQETTITIVVISESPKGAAIHSRTQEGPRHLAQTRP